MSEYTYNEIVKRLKRVEILTNTKTSESELFDSSNPNFRNQPKFDGEALATKAYVDGLTYAGTQGTAGTYGTYGTQGTAGTYGTYGTYGTQGTAGTYGTYGTQGTAGTYGTYGTYGTQGTAGTQGTYGTQGTAGTYGTYGTQGTQGTAGTAGENGTQGTEGTAGENGTQGTAGTYGTQGTAGTYGTQGTAGTAGTAGTRGTAGTTSVSSYAYVYNVSSSSQQIAGGNTIPFSNSGATSSIVYQEATSSMTVFQNGRYKIEFNVSFTSGNGAAIAIYVNESVIESTNIGVIGSSGQISQTCILSLMTNDEITLRNTSGNPLTMSSSPFVGAQISIIKIADTPLPT